MRGKAASLANLEEKIEKEKWRYGGIFLKSRMISKK
jgi:hypothetical protein